MLTLLLAGTALAAIPHLLIVLLVVCIAIGVACFVINKFVPRPLNGYAIAALVVVGAVVLILELLKLA